MQAFTDLVGTSAVPAHAFDMAELTELTPTLDIAMAAHDTADQAGEAVGGTFTGPTAVGTQFSLCFCTWLSG